MWGAIKKAINSDLTTPLNSLLDTLLSRLTAGRASNLDNLNASISSRQPDVLSSTQANRLDADVSSRSSHSAQDVADLVSGGIKSVQRGKTRLADNINDVTINSVDLSKTFITFFYRDEDDNGLTFETRYLAHVQLTSSTNLRLEIGRGSDGSAFEFYACWEVVEFE